jgi:hypothetical protein
VDDREQIERLIYEYTYRLDGGDFEGFGRLFADADWCLSGEREYAVSGADAVTAWLRDNILVYDGIPLTSHVITNVTIDVAPDARTASARSYLTAFQGVPPDFPLQVIFTGGYLDAFAKRDGTWAFTRREITTRCVGDLRYHVRGV